MQKYTLPTWNKFGYMFIKLRRPEISNLEKGNNIFAAIVLGSPGVSEPRL